MHAEIHGGYYKVYRIKLFTVKTGDIYKHANMADFGIPGYIMSGTRMTIKV